LTSSENFGSFSDDKRKDVAETSSKLESMRLGKVSVDMSADYLPLVLENKSLRITD
jgi:hypothetical protein